MASRVTAENETVPAALEAEHAAHAEDRRMALAAAAVLSCTVLAASYFLLQGARRYALLQDCAIPAQAACDIVALK